MSVRDPALAIEGMMEHAPHKPEPFTHIPDSHRAAYVNWAVVARSGVDVKPGRGKVPAAVLPIPKRVVVCPAIVDGYLWYQFEFHELMKSEEPEAALARSWVAAVLDEVTLMLMGIGLPMLHMRSARFELARNMLIIGKSKETARTFATRAGRLVGTMFATLAAHAGDPDASSKTHDALQTNFRTYRINQYRNLLKAVSSLTGLKRDPELEAAMERGAFGSSQNDRVGSGGMVRAEVDQMWLPDFTFEGQKSGHNPLGEYIMGRGTKAIYTVGSPKEEVRVREAMDAAGTKAAKATR